MRILLHTCCAPCTIVPFKILRQAGHQVTGYFYNPNIHPFREFEKRQTTLREYARSVGLEIRFAEGYDLEVFLVRTRPWGPERCRACYRLRLEAAAREALGRSCEAFSTTLLYSRYQKHDWIRETGEEISRRTGMPFFYVDFRVGWQEGVDESRALGLYRQPYCGCIFSERERYERRTGKTV
ncbi:MAG: epoxyqueuosine reductase QueH [Deltaproteobacteria bacterium]|nr:epoxyqueuosine reductase QueH [Deltaproteobacteria bacterium]